MITRHGESLEQSWPRQLLVKLSVAPGLALPMKSLLQERAGWGFAPQQLFEGIKLLLERGEVELQEDDADQPLLALACGHALPGAPLGRCGSLSLGELAQLAALVGEACGCRRAPAPPSIAEDSTWDRTRPVIRARTAAGAERRTRQRDYLPIN